MKTLFLLFACVLVLTLTISGQSIIYAGKTFKVSSKSEIPLDKTKLSDNISFKISDSIRTAMNLNDTIKLLNNATKYNIAVTDVNKSYLKKANNLQSSTLADSLNKGAAVKPILSAGISNLENTDKSYGSLSIGALFRLSDYKPIGNGWIDPDFLYVMFGAKTTTSNDSAIFHKILLFPELTKRDFVLGYFREYRKNDWTVSPTLEFSLNSFSDTSNTTHFNSQSIVMGLKIQKCFMTGTVYSFVAIYPYYSFITVDKKFNNEYALLSEENEIPNNFQSFGLHISAQATNVILFCNMKYIASSRDIVKSQDLKGFVYTIGTQIAL